MEGDFEHLGDDFEGVFDNPTYIRSQFKFRLLDLPPELMVRICQLAVVQTYTFDPTKAPLAKHQAKIVRQPAITRTCRLLRKESLRAFYRDNNFEAFHWAKKTCIRNWLTAIGVENLRAMRSLTFHCKFNTDFWETKFDEIGIKTKAEMADDQSKAVGSLRTLRINFL